MRLAKALWFAIWMLLCGCTYTGRVIDRYIEPAGFDSYVTGDGLLWIEHDARYWIKVQLPRHRRWFCVSRLWYGRLRVGDTYNSDGMDE